jgi:hypothetical protein
MLGYREVTGLFGDVLVSDDALAGDPRRLKGAR